MEWAYHPPNLFGSGNPTFLGPPILSCYGGPLRNQYNNRASFNKVQRGSLLLQRPRGPNGGERDGRRGVPANGRYNYPLPISNEVWITTIILFNDLFRGLLNWIGKTYNKKYDRKHKYPIKFGN